MTAAASHTSLPPLFLITVDCAGVPSLTSRSILAEKVKGLFFPPVVRRTRFFSPYVSGHALITSNLSSSPSPDTAMCLAPFRLSSRPQLYQHGRKVTIPFSLEEVGLFLLLPFVPKAACASLFLLPPRVISHLPFSLTRELCLKLSGELLQC